VNTIGGEAGLAWSSPGLAELLGSFRHEIAEVEAAGVVPRISALVRPAVVLDHAEHGSCRLGGLPLLDAESAWPVRNGRPLPLLAVIDLAAVADFGLGLGLPADGYLNFFAEPVDWDAPTADSDVHDPHRWAVVRAGPAAEVKSDGVVGLPACPLEPRPVFTLPDPWDLVFDPPTTTVDDIVRHAAHSGPAISAFDEAMRAYGASLFEPWLSAQAIAAPYDMAGSHQFGGWPIPMQGPVGSDCVDGIERAARSHFVGAGSVPEAVTWRLLLQLHTDDAAGLQPNGDSRYWMFAEGSERYTIDEPWLIEQSD